MRRLLIIGALAALVAATSTSPVAAAPPVNDDRATATIVGPLPFNARLDTSEATSDPSDPPCASYDDGDPNPTVWFSFTPTETRRYIASTRGSDYDTTLWVGTERAGLDEIDCSDDWGDVTSRVYWRGKAGVRYLIMVGACCGTPGGALAFRVKKAPPPPSFTLSLADQARVSANGKIEVRGAIGDCRGTDAVALSIRVRQDFGRHIIRGRRGTMAACGGGWRVQVGNYAFRFAKGEARVRVRATACNMVTCASQEITRMVRVRQ